MVNGAAVPDLVRCLFPAASGPARRRKPAQKPGSDHGVDRPQSSPARIDDVNAAPLPAACPECGGRKFSEPIIAQQYQTEIPRRPIVRQFEIEIACCRDCGVWVQGRHPLQTSDALGAVPTRSLKSRPKSLPTEKW